MDISEVKRLLQNLDGSKICFSPHFYMRSAERPINEGLVRSLLLQQSKLEKVEKGKSEERFKIWLKMSRRYSLVIIVDIHTAEGLKVISAWNTDRKWQNKLRI